MDGEKNADDRTHYVSPGVEDAGNENSTACGALPLREPSSDLAMVNCLPCLRALAAAREFTARDEPTGHRVVIEFDGGGTSAQLICPDSGCLPAQNCASCGRDLSLDEAEGIAPCYDCKDAAAWRDECWIKTWFDNLDAAELLAGKVTVEIDAEWDMDHPVARIRSVLPSPSAETGLREALEEIRDQSMTVPGATWIRNRAIAALAAARPEPATGWAEFVCAHGHRFAVGPAEDTGRAKCAICGTITIQRRAAARPEPEWTWARLYSRLDDAILKHKQAQGDPGADEALWATYKAVDADLFGYAPAHPVPEDDTAPSAIERAWINGWGSALGAVRVARDMAEHAREIGANEWGAAKAVGEMLEKLVDLIGSATGEFLEKGREVGLASVPDEETVRRALGPRWAAASSSVPTSEED